MALGQIIGQTPVNPKTTASNVEYDNSKTSSIITGKEVQTAIDQLFTSVSNGKNKIASAITDKGVSTSPNSSFDVMAQNIGKIRSGYSNFYPYFFVQPVAVTASSPTTENNAILTDVSHLVNMSTVDTSTQCIIDGSWPKVKDWLMIYGSGLVGSGLGNIPSTLDGEVFALSLCGTNPGPKAQLKHQYIKGSQTEVFTLSSGAININARFLNFSVSSQEGSAPRINFQTKVWGRTSAGIVNAYFPMMIVFLF